MKTVLIIGGTSDVGIATARVYASKGWRVVLAGRSEALLYRNVLDIQARYGHGSMFCLIDVLELTESVLNCVGPLPDTAICVVGLLGDQARAERDWTHARTIIRTNFEGPALILEDLAHQMETRGYGTLVGVCSVAGDRGRASNYFYGAAKAGFAAFLSGLRNRLGRTHIHVLTVKAGFIRTQMTLGMSLPAPLTATAEEVGQAIYRAAEVTKADIIYVRSIWALIMGIICIIPERLFKKMSV